MRVESQPAYILHQRPFRDTSQILEVFSRDYGRLSIMSRGSRGAKSRQKNLLQPFRPLVLSWSGKGEMPTLSKVEMAIQSVPLFKHKSLVCGMYVNELLMYLTHKHDVQAALFAVYHQTINQLMTSDNLEKELRLFELNLLEQLGYALNFQNDASTGTRVDDMSDYQFVVDHGPVLLLGNREDSAVPVIKGSHLNAIAERKLDDKHVLKDAKRIMRYVLASYLGNRQLKSRELFR